MTTVRIDSPQFVVFGAAEGPALGLGTHSEVRGSTTDPARHMVGLASDDIQADWKRLQGAGVKFIEAPKHYGNLWIATLTDPDGNRIVLIERRRSADTRVLRCLRRDDWAPRMALLDCPR